MPLELKPPGDRGRKYWYIRGTFRGKRYDESTSTLVKEEAERRKAELETAIIADQYAADVKTFDYAADQFKKFRNPKAYDVKRIDAVTAVLSGTPVSEITQAHIVSVADIIRPGYHPATRNRDVVRPISSVLHYAADNKWCGWMRIKKFREPTSEKRAVSLKTARKLIKATTGQQKLLLLWLFKHGDRISDTLNILGPNIDLKRRVYKMRIGKSDKWRLAPMDKEVTDELRRLYKRLPAGRIFSWGNHHNVYRWLNPLCEGLKIEFTPHMARHSILTWIANSGGSIVQIKGRGGHADIKSAEPYLSESLTAVRDITARFKLT